jgi:hypothetical protein
VSSARLSGMRTTLDIDDRLMGSLLERLPGASKTRAIETAIEQYLAADAYDGLRDMGGTLEFDVDAFAAARAADEAREARLDGRRRD